ncbi:hypothetical protein I4U23_021917 [Adineta vaga]|nr:hypothetical protein I4U23_021917 [Adineta vaga]
MNNNSADCRTSQNPSEIQTPSMTTVSSPRRRKIGCIIVILIIGIVTVLAVAFLVLKYHWEIRMEYSTTITLAGKIVFEKTRVYRWFLHSTMQKIFGFSKKTPTGT